MYEYKAIEMHMDEGDMDEEHAKAVIALAIDNTASEDSLNLSEYHLQKALDQICEDYGIELTGDDRKDMIIASIKEVLGELVKQSRSLK